MSIMIELPQETPLLDKIEAQLLENRIIYLNGGIDGETVDSTILKIKYLNVRDQQENDFSRPIHLYISSEGGDAYLGWALVREIENSKSPVWTYNLSYCMSMALPIFLSGKKKFMSKYAVLLYHELRGSMPELTRQEVKRLDKEYDRLQTIYDDFIIANSELTQEDLNTHQEKVSDWYINFSEAEKYKMFDVEI